MRKVSELTTVSLCDAVLTIGEAAAKEFEGGVPAIQAHKVELEQATKALSSKADDAAKRKAAAAAKRAEAEKAYAAAIAALLEQLLAGKIKADEYTTKAAKALKVRDAAMIIPLGISCKVSAKGAVSVYGLQRMPVTLYMEQWERMEKEVLPVVKAFIAENEGKTFDATEYGDDGKATGKTVKVTLKRGK